MADQPEPEDPNYDRYNSNVWPECKQGMILESGQHCKCTYAGVNPYVCGLGDGERSDTPWCKGMGPTPNSMGGCSGFLGLQGTAANNIVCKDKEGKIGAALRVAGFTAPRLAGLKHDDVIDPYRGLTCT